MKKTFNNEHTPKSSENCDKYSKSVSYETLVGGTATIGTDIKQTQRLFSSSAVKPLTAVGTFSAFNNAEKVVEKWLQISPVLKLVKVLGLLAVLFFSLISESRAEGCHAPTNGVCKTFAPSGKCGIGCDYVYVPKDKTIYITTTSNNASINRVFDPWLYENEAIPAKNIIIDGAVKLESNAFTRGIYTISGVDGTLILNDIEHHGFGAGITLSGNIVIPADANFGSIALCGVTLAKNAKIYCAVENCEQKMRDACNAYSNGETYRIRCINTIDNFVSNKKLLPYPDGCLNLNTKFECTKCKNENFKLNDGECDRLRWTPAEAAEVLHDDSTNSVTITFKK